MKKKVRLLVAGLLAAVFLCGLWLIGQQLWQYGQAQQSRDKAQQIAFGGGETPTTVPQTRPAGETIPPATEEAVETPAIPLDASARFLQQVDVYSLRQINPEVLGWIYLPDTAISYPLMQTTERDKYLQYSWDGTPNNSGSIFLEKSNHRDFTDFNTIIYGHHITNGTMFQPLMNYKDPVFLDSHPYVYIASADQIYRYRIFSAYEAPVDSDTYRLYFADDAAKLAAIEHYLQGNADSSLSVEDRFLTLSTCTGTGVYSIRWVVQGVLDAQWQK